MTKPKPKTEIVRAKTITFKGARGEKKLCVSCDSTLSKLNTILCKRPIEKNRCKSITVVFTPDFYAGGAFNGWHVGIKSE